MRRSGFLVLLLLFLGSVFFLPNNVAAACSPLASDKGQTTGTITVAKAGQYTLWVRMWAPNSTSDSVFAQVDDQCPVAVNDARTSSGFLWANFSDGKPAQSITYNLTAGSHTITLAGREVGAGVDRVLLTSDPTCVPVDMGANCLQGAAAGASTNPTGQQVQTPSQAPSPGWPYKPDWWVVGICAIVVVAAALFLFRLYRRFMQSVALAPMPQPGTFVGSGLHEHARLDQRLLHFVRHHKLIVAVWAVITLVAVAVGIVAAASSQSVFEAEAGKLSGGATLVANAGASGGQYVLFQNNPPGQSGSGGAQTGGGGKTGGGSSAGSGGSNGGGGQSGGGGGSTQWACALPKYPNPNCTGVPAGTSFSRTVNTDYYANTPGEVIDSWHITGDLVIQADNITIKNSLIDGHIDNDNYPSVTSFTVTDSTIGPAACDTQGWPSLNAHDFTATRVFLRGHQDGIDVVGDNVTVTDSFVQPCYQPPEVVGSDGFHSDGVQDQCGGPCTHLTFIHNTFDSQAFYPDSDTGVDMMTGNSAIYLGSPYNGTGYNVADVILKNNLFLGGGYSVAILWDNVGDKANWIITDNAWVQGEYAYDKWRKGYWEYGTWAFGPNDTSGSCSHITWSGNSIVTVNGDYAVTATIGPTDCVN